MFLRTSAFFLKTCALLIALCLTFSLACLGLKSVEPPAKPVDRILIEKSRRTMSLMSGGQVVKSYKVVLGGQPIGAKDRQGDRKAPQGIYSVDRKIPDSRFHKALHISYPNPADRDHAHRLGISPGGDVEIHGLGEHWGWVGNQHRLRDWTDGCVAVTNEEIDEIYVMVRTGTAVEIRP
jgi:murein L,D-transpeptidase YafK